VINTAISINNEVENGNTVEKTDSFDTNTNNNLDMTQAKLAVGIKKSKMFLEVNFS
jgi:hypothetical protein